MKFNPYTIARVMGICLCLGWAFTAVYAWATGAYIAPAVGGMLCLLISFTNFSDALTFSGHWVLDNASAKAQCSVCGSQIASVSAEDCHYCPECGAKMNGIVEYTNEDSE